MRKPKMALRTPWSQVTAFYTVFIIVCLYAESVFFYRRGAWDEYLTVDYIPHKKLDSRGGGYIFAAHNMALAAVNSARALNFEISINSA